ncbi:MAG: hypothetical protein QM770_02105 [Tepidisphaeraceae bacterium]
MPSPVAPPTSPLRTRQACLLTFAIVTLAATTYFAGRPLYVDLLVVALWTISLLGWGAAVLRILLPTHDDRSPVLRAATSFALGLGIVGLSAHALGLAGWLNRGSAVALLAAGGVLAIRRIAKAWTMLEPWLRENAGAAWFTVLLAPIVALSLTGAMILPGVLFGADEPAGYDVVGYHLQVPREWFELGRIVPLRHNAFSTFPMLTETHSLLMMHLRGGPWAGMYSAQLAHTAIMIALLAATYGAARSLGRGRATVAALLVGTTPWTAMLGAVAYNELALMLYTVLAVGWGWRLLSAARETGEHARQVHGVAVVLGLMLGLACATKYTGFVTTLVLVPVVLVVTLLGACARPRAGLRRAITALVLATAIGAVVTSPWLIRNTLWTGNPVFPLATNVLGKWHWDDGQVERFNAAHAPRADQQSVIARLKAFAEQVANDSHYGAVRFASTETTPSAPMPSVLLLMAPLFVLLGARQRETWLLTMYLLGLTAYWLFATHLQGRFYTQAIPVLALLTVTPRGPGFRSWPVVLSLLALPGVLGVVDTARKFANTLPLLGATDARQLQEQVLLPADVYNAIYGTDRPIVLVGDCKAFWYSIPMSRLTYRYVFDVPSTGNNPVQAWAADAPRDATVIVDPGELSRFARTYRKVPPLEASSAAQVQPFVLRRE